ncbi:MAG: CPBP family intramembrane metalloprotease [Nitrosopumilaceae archaeon]|uniref:CPBP family intramembrane metalloprotease n=2 Tax=Candidatus Nitrosomaritimum aestuariumsis TaxID=3342354 RepID=A0AC60W6K8_9ARCH|nr:CPBP family intramembrane metalloprotease [Nitrosopumilaceae archaeon]MBA4460069.1 CPBP family intramembrane metalloprotease [Nitrosopumilaceae archaeon]MBA4460986.1 CPBP family intramembrane metalloprotease [Nitrosopumilaceae archaeon]MBA4462883.1 CPBP family intramembrane metalloprotease [Nitrosopumilaceae archaeon]
MENSNKILQAIGIPHSALLSVIFGMMILSFPLGTFVMFHTELGDDINFELPLNQFELFVAGIGISIPIDIEIGDAFIFLWLVYVILFTVALLGPKDGFLKTMSSLLSHGKLKTKSNYLVAVTKWFSILILVSAIINFVQESFGVSTVPPPAENNLIQFFYVTLAPITEEIGFRVLLIGLPLFAIYSHKSSVKHFFRSLWAPSDNLHIYNSRRAIILIVVVAAFFGLSHIISGEPWSNGKFAQATASGIILGWLYFRFGLVSAILVHWATNYFVFSYVNFISQVSLISLEEAFSHSLVHTMEIIFLISGVLSVCILLLSYYTSKKKPALEI